MLLTYIKAIVTEWTVLLGGSVVLIVVTWLDSLDIWSPGPSGYGLLAGYLFLAGSYFAWAKERRKVIGLTQSLTDGVAELARLRKEAVTTLYAVRLSNEKELVNWKTRWQEWRQRVLKVLEQKFLEPEFLKFENLGFLEGGIIFSNQFNGDHQQYLIQLCQEMEILEEIVDRYVAIASKQMQKVVEDGRSS